MHYKITAFSSSFGEAFLYKLCHCPLLGVKDIMLNCLVDFEPLIINYNFRC